MFGLRVSKVGKTEVHGEGHALLDGEGTLGAEGQRPLSELNTSGKPAGGMGGGGGGGVT